VVASTSQSQTVPRRQQRKASGPAKGAAALAEPSRKSTRILQKPFLQGANKKLFK
jgi:hypothetical protein